MTDIQSKYAKRAVPRYTSYPTAPHFCPDFPQARYRSWLAEIEPTEAVSLYLHVPFCKQMCWYCGSNMKLAARYEPIADYVEALIAEITLVAEALPARMRIGHLHWGGGTPTALEPGDLARVMDHLRARFNFADGAELAIESDPRTLKPEMTAMIGRLGFTRASFGVQEFDPRVQEAINRIQPPDMVARTVTGLRDAGVSNINFDLIYGLPYQTVDTLLDSIDLCQRMAPDRIALFGYAHVPWMAKNQRKIPEAALPDSAGRAAQAASAREALQANGYQAIGLDHFALPDDEMAIAAQQGRLHRNFQGYTTDTAQTLLGLGATSIGRTPAGYVQNIAETGAWSRAVAEGKLPVARGLALNDDDRLRAAVIERIMCDGAVDLAKTGASFGRPPDWWANERAELQSFCDDGLLTILGGEIELTGAGENLSRVVASVFDSYLAQSKARHSVAV
jgi:oxygen-independent coproporphyrinogen-3 oxidase